MHVVELRQLFEATPEAVDLTDGHLEPNGFPHVDAAIAAEGAPRTVGLSEAVQHIRPAAGDATI